MRKSILFGLLLATGHLSASQPNIVFVFVDDMGYSDIGCFGGEIETPHIDQLADEGLRLTNFRVTPMCVTSRASLLCGMEYSAGGYGNINQGLSFAHLLRDAGYHTSITGKVHAFNNLSIGNPATDYGFDRFFGFRGGATDNFKGDANWRLDNQPFNSFGPDFYATDAITDHTLDFISEAVSREKPFFSWVCYNAPHGKLQAREADVRKYYDNGIYAAGWDTLRTQRLQRQKTLGIVSPDTKLADYGVEVPRWNLLPQTSDDRWVLQKDFEALCMAAYAGMMDSVDQNVGRIIARLEDPDNDPATNDSVIENTLIIFCSDNGGAYAGLYSARDALPWDRTSNATFNTNYGWGALQNTPFRSYKHSSFEGGIRSPFVAHWPAGISLPEGSILHQSTNLWDFYPTFLELAGATYPTSYAEKATKPLMGESLVPLFSDADSEAGSDLFISHYDTRSKGLVAGDWKIARYADGPWELFNIAQDPIESKNLAGRQAGKLASLTSMWDAHFAANPPPGSANPGGSVWNLSPGDEHRGFGYDRIMTGITRSDPEYMAGGVPLDTKLSFDFVGPIDFNNTANLKIRLQRYGSPEILWEADPESSHPAQGQNAITFDDFPTLDPDTHYYITCDPGWARYVQGGTSRAVRGVREAAYAYRFKSAGSYGSRLEDQLTVPPGGSALPADDADGNGRSDFLEYLLPGQLELKHDTSTNPATPFLGLVHRNAVNGESLEVQYATGLDGLFTPLLAITGRDHSTTGNLIEEVIGTAGDLSTDYAIRLDPTQLDPSRGFFRVKASKQGEEPLAIWTFRENSVAPVTLSTLATPLDASFAAANSGIVASAGPFSFDDPLTSWSGSQLPSTGIGTQIQTAVIAETEMMITRITYTGTLWTNRPLGTSTSVNADVVAWLNDALDSPGIVSSRRTLASTNGGRLEIPFTFTYPVNGKVLQSGQKWELRLRIQDDNSTAYLLNEEGFGIDTVTVYGKATM